MSFQELIQDLNVLRAIEELGFSQPTEIQALAIPHILQNRDIRASAKTGTGKTAAFMLPALAKVAKPGKGPRVLILVPTRELAMQVASEAVKLGRYLPHVASVCLYGGVPYPLQNKKLAKHYDILIATPGRLIDHIERGRVKLDRLEMLILDEADRMLDMGFIEPVEYVASLIPQACQRLMFSATYGKSVIKLAAQLLKEPIEVNIEHKLSNPTQIRQSVQVARSLSDKYALLDKALAEEGIDQAIVFSATKVQVDQIVDYLREKGSKAGALHGDMNQRQRSKTMRELREGKIRVLVATDVAARGIDVLTISHVINFDLPNNLEEYIHRIGRTGRAGAEGVAVSFASGRDRDLCRSIEKLAGLEPAALGAPGKKEGKGGQKRDHKMGAKKPHFFGKKKRFGAPSGGFSARRKAPKPKSLANR